MKGDRGGDAPIPTADRLTLEVGGRFYQGSELEMVKAMRAESWTLADRSVRDFVLASVAQARHLGAPIALDLSEDRGDGAAAQAFVAALVAAGIARWIKPGEPLG